ncbi:MAG: hypothetical protein HY707_10675 [Ignavibacteriae bacterium]|nr:hypothetical protein [Ignavibacteriota bacterium]
MRQRDIEADILRKYSRYMVSLDPILNQIGSVRTLHAGGFRYEENGKEATTPLNKVALTIEISHATIVNFDMGVFAQSIYEFTEQHVAEMHRMMYRTLDTVTQLTGNVFNAKEKPPSADMILDMLERLPIRFDEKDEPVLPQIIAGPDLFQKLVNIKFTPEQEERNKRIIEIKRREFHAKKRYRRLSYIH